MKQQVKINKVKSNPSNPRIIKNDKFLKLVKSIQEFPEMLKLRPIVVDEDMVVLGGNMRLKASKQAGLKDIWIEVAEGLTEEQKKEFIVKDNVGFGEWDWAMLGNEWNTIKITEWGLDVWENQDDKNDLDADLEWTDMPEFNQENKMPTRQLIVSFKNEDDIKSFAKLLNQQITDKTKSLWFPEVKNVKQFDKTYE
tara:strand:+ start:7301 stop:7888 length:588 start_codon:yes stop_codon:yes gene_type:complete